MSSARACLQSQCYSAPRSLRAHLRQSSLVKEDPPAVVRERSAVRFWIGRVEDVVDVLGVLHDGVAQSEITEGKVDLESRVGEEEEGVSFSWRLGIAESETSGAARRVKHGTYRSLDATPMGRPSILAASPAFVS